MAPRQTVELEYGPSLWFGVPGSLGYPPQPFHGVPCAVIAAATWWIMGVTAIVLLIVTG